MPAIACLTMARRQKEPTHMTITITCGTTQVDFDALPEASRKYLAQKAANHLFANVLDSQVTGHMETLAREAYDEGKGDGPAWSKLTDADRKARTADIRASYSDDDVAALKTKFVDKTLAALRDGTMATRTTASRKSPEDKIREDIIMGFIRVGAEAAKAAGKTVKIPTGAELTDLMAKVADRKADEIAKELKARLARGAKAADGLDDLFT